MRGRRLTGRGAQGTFPGRGRWAEQGSGRRRGPRGVQGLGCPALPGRGGVARDSVLLGAQCILATGAVGEFQSGEGRAQRAQNLLSWVETEPGGTGEVRETCRGCHRCSDSWVVVRTLLPPPCFPDAARFS